MLIGVIVPCMSSNNLDTLIILFERPHFLKNNFFSDFNNSNTRSLCVVIVSYRICACPMT